MSVDISKHNYLHLFENMSLQILFGTANFCTIEPTISHERIYKLIYCTYYQIYCCSLFRLLSRHIYLHFNSTYYMVVKKIETEMKINHYVQ